jgi:aminomuconate-semialdehyde/2-hydroxymuconate-6-semialdehyde dehydrogenase
MDKLYNYIDGRHVDPISGEYIDNYDPASGEVWSYIPDSDERDILIAIAAAKSAFPSWSLLSQAERSAYLIKMADAIEKETTVWAEAESRDNGKPIHVARTVDIPRAVDNFRFFGQAATMFSSESYASSHPAHHITLRQPLGVVACISPWNLPLYLFTWKIAPALAMGNTVIAKPSEITPYTAYLLSKLSVEIGLPPGVLNIVHGYGSKLGAGICSHPDIKAISFTGGTTTGRTIASLAAPHFKKLSLELGGKNPTIIWDDCDYPKMLDTVVRSSFSNQGQICLCGSRILIHKNIYERFKKDFVARVNALRVGDPSISDADMGALVSQAHMEKVLSYIDLAEQEGGTILTGGSRIHLDGRCRDGYYVRPTVIEGLDPHCRTNQEEIFGPVVTIATFESEADVLAIANGTSYGLAASLWTQDITRAHRMSALLEFGIVWVNCWMVRDLRTPFGGVKNSGMGREGGLEAMRFFTEPKSVTIAY